MSIIIGLIIIKMNQTLKKINQERILFFDIEDVRRNKELDINSKEFELFRKKIRNRDTDEYLPNEEVLEEYKKKAALKMGYTKIVSIGVGFIKEGEVHIKALTGTEEEILKQFCEITQSFDYVCGSNIIRFDLPMIAVNSYKYFDVSEILPDRFVTSGKKPWELKSVIDLQEIFQGTHYVPNSLDEMCYHFEVPSPKTDLDGSMVSEEYWNNGVEKINKYVKQDVFACVNLFKKMRFQPIFEEFIDKNEIISTEPFAEERPILEKIYNVVSIDENTKTTIENILKKKKPNKKELVILEDILTNTYINNKMFESDSEPTKTRKRTEIKEILDAAITK